MTNKHVKIKRKYIVPNIYYTEFYYDLLIVIYLSRLSLVMDNSRESVTAAFSRISCAKKNYLCVCWKNKSLH